MDNVMLHSFLDELVKISAAMPETSQNPLAQSNPMGAASGPKPSTSLKPQQKGTNYSIVNTQAPAAAFNSAVSSKSVPPPPVRT
jgi:hypothetical protein